MIGTCSLVQENIALPVGPGNVDTGHIEKFSANKNIRKILKVSHFYLEFSWNESHNKLKHSQRVPSEFSGSHSVSLEFQGLGPKSLMKPLRMFNSIMVFCWMKIPNKSG